MKRVFVVFLIGCLAICGMVGCDSEEVDKEYSTTNQIEKEETTSEEVTSEEVTTENITTANLVCDASSEWENITYKYSAVQIDDVLYTPLCTVEEFIQKANSSQFDYTYSFDVEDIFDEEREYNADIVMDVEDTVTIIVDKDGKEWFEAYAMNNTGDNTTLGKMTITKITPYHNYESDHRDIYDLYDYENDYDNGVYYSTLPYCRVIDGRIFSDFRKLTYGDIEEMSNSIFKDCSIEQELYDDTVEVTFFVRELTNVTYVDPYNPNEKGVFYYLDTTYWFEFDRYSSEFIAYGYTTDYGNYNEHTQWSDDVKVIKSN